jgi:hypothetical protein
MTMTKVWNDNNSLNCHPSVESPSEYSSELTRSTPTKVVWDDKLKNTGIKIKK